LPHPDAIAIDGPAASGKSTIGQLLAEELGYLYFDTGVMYRAVTWAVLNRGIEVSNEQAVTQLSRELLIDVRAPTEADGRQYTVLVDGQDVTWELRLPEVEVSVSPVSAYSGVREAMTVQQRRIGARGKVVMVGRDIGTVVLPNAPLKIYLDATAECRARRRHAELVQRGQHRPYREVLAEMRRRDKIDSERAIAPLHPAVDAVIIDTTRLGVADVLKIVRHLVANRDP
jgi:CMP/dCMP kinase